MKLLIVAIFLLGLVVSQSSEESVLHMLADLKKNAELELEGLEMAWERRLKAKQDLADQINGSLIDQRAECNNKESDVKQKLEDMNNTIRYIEWMLLRQSSNKQRIDILEANRCAQTNNYVNDIRNRKVALQLIKFLRDQLGRLGSEASLAQIKHYNEKLQKFLNIYKTGKLLSMVETLEIENGELIVPEVEMGIEEEAQLQTNSFKMFSFLQIQHKTTSKENQDDETEEGDGEDDAEDNEGDAEGENAEEDAEDDVEEEGDAEEDDAEDAEDAEEEEEEVGEAAEEEQENEEEAEAEEAEEVEEAEEEEEEAEAEEEEEEQEAEEEELVGGAAFEEDDSADDESAGGADNAVVMIPGCDDSVQTVVVVQNDDGSGNNPDFNINIKNGGGSGGSSTSSKHGKGHKDEPLKEPHHPHPIHETEEEEIEREISELFEESEGESEDEPVEESEGESEEEAFADHIPPLHPDDEEVSEVEEPQPETPHIAVEPVEAPVIAEEKPVVHIDCGAEDDEENDFPDTVEGFHKLLDTLEKRIQKAIECSQNDEIRSAMAFIDFKLHIQLENETFAKHIEHNKEYKVKQANQLTGRQQAAILCGARLKQLAVSHKIALNDVDAAKKFYEEQKAIKQDEVNTFDDVYNIYVSQVK